MQISESFHLVRQEYQIPFGPNQSINRSVNIGIIAAERIMLIDSGVRNSVLQVKDYLNSLNKSLADIDWMVFTHCHPDHIGGALSYKEYNDCRIAAPRSERDFIEHINWQADARPIPGFQKMVEGSVPVDIDLVHGNIIHFGRNRVNVIGTEGHSSGHLAYFFENDGVLFTGDCVPVPRMLPIYENINASIQAIRRLSNIKGIKHMVSSRDNQIYHGKDAYDYLDSSLDWLQEIHNAVISARAKYNDLPVVAREVIDELDIPHMSMNPLFLKTIQAHLSMSDNENLLSIA